MNTIASILAAHSFFVTGANFTNVQFKADDQPSFKGNMKGVEVEFGWQSPRCLFTGFEFDWSKGTLYSPIGKRNLVDINTSEKLGFTFTKNCTLTNFYSGLGFRFLGHHFIPKQVSTATFSGTYFPPDVSDLTSIKFNYYEFYLPVGIYTEYSMSNNCYRIGLNFEVMPQLFTTVNIGPLSGAFWTIVPNMENFLVEMPIFCLLSHTSNFSLVINPFYEQWHDGASTAKTSGGSPLGLPSNSYKFFGVELNLILFF